MKKNKDKVEKQKNFWKDWLPYIIIIIIVIIIRSYIVTPIKVNGTSMDTTLKNGETMLLNKINYRLHGASRFDIVVVKTSNTYLIKRVIGLPGETVSYKDGILYIDGKDMKDNYSLTETDDFDEVTLSDDEYFVMGDNRDVSVDSRAIGPVNKDQILGTTDFIIFPLNKFGKV